MNYSLDIRFSGNLEEDEKDENHDSGHDGANDGSGGDRDSSEEENSDEDDDDDPEREPQNFRYKTGKMGKGNVENKGKLKKKGYQSCGRIK